MNAGIIGAGSMGSIFSWFFSRAKVKNVIFENDENTVSSLKKGLSVINNEKTEKIDLNINSNPAILSDCNLIFIFVKSYSTEDAVKSIKNNIKPDSIVISLQNGLGNYDIISKHIPDERIIYGTTTIGAAKTDASTVKFGGTGSITIGGKNKKNLDITEKLLNNSGFNVSVTSNPEKAVWEKAIINAGINPLGAILSVPNGEIIKNEYALDLQKKIITESVTTAETLGLDIKTEYMIDLTKKVCLNTSANRCSMLQDIANKKRTEIDSINGKIIEYGKRFNLETPVNETIYSLIKAMETFHMNF